MVYGWQSSDIATLNKDLFVLISSPNDDIQVRGLITSKSTSFSSDYSNKFDGTDADSKSGNFAAILQSGVYSNDIEFLRRFEGKTLITKAQTIQIFTGLDPIDLNLEIEFIAQRDTDLEVEKAIKQLIFWKSPKLAENSFETMKEVFDLVMAGGGDYNDALGEIPNEINVSFMQSRYDTTFIIENISLEEDKIMLHKDGGRIRQKVSLSLKSKTGITKNDLL